AGVDPPPGGAAVAPAKAVEGRHRAGGIHLEHRPAPNSLMRTYRTQKRPAFRSRAVEAPVAGLDKAIGVGAVVAGKAVEGRQCPSGVHLEHCPAPYRSGPW